MTENTLGGKTKFSLMSKLFEEIHKHSRDKKIDVMKQFITSFQEQSKNHENASFYPILRLVLPHLERERGPYGIKENTLAKIYIRILCISKQSKDAQKLLNYRAPQNTSNVINDFADTAYYILKSRFSDDKGNSLTVFDVNQHLDNIATKHASHDSRGVDEELAAMMLKMSPIEQKWLIRIILKDLRLGLSQDKILFLFHRDARDLFDVSNDLQKICTVLKDPSVRLNEIEITMFQPFRPMLCARCDVQVVEKEITKADHHIVEIKFDGERFQLHHENEEFKYFSRNGYDYTNTYGCNMSNGILTPHLAKCLSPSVKSCILDGEMMCWNDKQKCYTTKGMNIDVKFLKVGHVNKPCFCVFDVLFLNGKVLTNEPLSERIKIMDEIIQSAEGVMMNSAKSVVKSGNEIMELLNIAIENCEEGIVVKNPNSVYKPNARNAGWYKIKPEYTDGLLVELDLLIIGGYYGEGRRRGLVSQFLLGVADSRKNENGEPVLFYSVGRVGSGFKDEELVEVDQKLQKHWQRVKPNFMPPGIEWTKEKPDLWIKPNVSYILQVKATEVVRSNAFKTEYTLRFPRIQKIRYDKPWTDCLTIDEYNNLRQSFGGKLTANYATKFDKEKPKTQTKRTKKTLTIDEQFDAKRLKNVEPSSALFQNREICVLTGHESISKNDLESKIIQYGGIVVQNPGTDTYCVIAHDENSLRVSNVIRLNKFNVVKPDWLLECIDKLTLRNWRPDDMIYSTDELKEKMSKEYDCYGDSYTEPIDLDRLKKLLQLVDDGGGEVSVQEKIELDRELFNGEDPCENPYGIFRGCFAYFYGSDEELAPERINKNDICKDIFKFSGGIEKEIIDENTTHIVFFSKCKYTENIRTQLNWEKCHIINEEWVFESWNVGKRLNESDFTFNDFKDE